MGNSSEAQKFGERIDEVRSDQMRRGGERREIRATYSDTSRDGLETRVESSSNWLTSLGWIALNNIVQTRIEVEVQNIIDVRSRHIRSENQASVANSDGNGLGHCGAGKSQDARKAESGTHGDQANEVVGGQLKIEG